MSIPGLPLSDIVDVVVLVQPQVPAIPTFNIGLIVGSTVVIPAGTRVLTYTSTAQMLLDGFLISSPEYIAAQILASQLTPPQSWMVGRQDLTSISTWVFGSGASGASYVVGDVIGVVQGGASGATITVLTVNGSGAITSGVLTTPGTGYTVAAGLAVTGGHGAGATVNITTIGDTLLQAVIACRTASSAWYGCMATGSVTADHQAIGAYAQGAATPMLYYYATQDAAALNGTTGNVFSFMKANSYSRIFGTYSTTQGGSFPNNIYAGAACMGVAMGLNTGLANSFFTMFGKTLVGITPEPLTETQVITIQSNNGNVYVSYAPYTLLTAGRVGSGQFMDEILNLDVLTANIQFNVMNIETQNPAVPQTDAGETQLIHAVNQACQSSADIGFLAPGGVWQGVQVLNLVKGQSLPAGYLAQAAAYSTQLQSDRQARKAMPIYVAIIEGGAAQSLLVGVFVQR